MLTYVINTSENKALKSDLLFELVGYNKISWMRSGLSAVEDCANEIIKRQQPMTAGEYRVVVLVDFLAFEKTLFPEENPVSEYIAIYKTLIEIYLHTHLYTPLRRAQLGFNGVEVFYIQYAEKNTIRENAAEKEQVALLLGLSDEHDRIVAEKRARADAARMPIETSEEEGEGTDKKSSRKKEKKSEESATPTLTRYESFRMEYRNGALEFSATDFCKDPDCDGKVSYDQFYTALAEKSTTAYRAFGSKSRTYVASAASARTESRAAFDNLNLSLALIRAYEQEVKFADTSGRDDVLDVPKMNKEIFFDTLRHAFGKVQSALELVRHTGNANGFYRLETRESISGDICRDEMSEEERRAVLAEAKKPSFEDKYKKIKELASAPPGKKGEEEKRELAAYMREYKKTRDDVRTDSSEGHKRELLHDTPKQDRYPSGLELENAVEKKRDNMRRILSAAISADYVGMDYGKEYTSASEAFDRHAIAQAALKKNVRTSVVCFFLTLLIMIVPYAVFQMSGKAFSFVYYGLAILVFGGIFVLSALLHLIPLWRDIKKAKWQMAEAYESCLLKRRMSMLRLERRYRVYLPSVEKIRGEIHDLYTLHEANREINRHMEEHREMLERVRDVLLGMLNSMQVPHKADGEAALDEDEFRIGESFRVNKVYKIFTIEVIEEIFEERRM